MGRPRKGWSLRDPRPPEQPYYSVRFTNKAGRRVELSTGTADPHEAPRAAEAIYIRERTSGSVARPRISPLLSFDELLAEWLADLEKTHDPETVATYAAYARKYIAHFGALANVTRPRMADYQRAALTRGVRKTVQKERSALNTFFGWCVEQEILAEEDVPQWPALPKKALGTRTGPQRAEPVDITAAQKDAFLAELPLWSRPRMGKPHAIRPRFIVMYETSLRPATLDALTIGIHWRPGENSLLLRPEDDKVRFGRRVPLSAYAQGALEFVAKALDLKDGDLIFGTHDYRSAVETARAAADLPENFAPYDLRHGRIGHLIDQPGAEPRAVMFLVGHKLMTTTNHYVRGQERGARALLSNGEESGRKASEMLRAKEGTRTLTGVTPLEPESGACDLESNGFDNVSGQDGPLEASSGQGFGDIPGTVSSAAKYLTLLRATEGALDVALAVELLGGDS